jgi:hypothetical protein
MSRTAPRDIREVIREEPLMQGRILKALAAGPLTVPEIAEAIGCPSQEVLYWVMGMRRYGKLTVSADPNDDGYYTFTPVDGGVPS